MSAWIPRAAIALAFVALMLFLGLELISPGYDPLYSLAWGQFMAEGHKPDVLHELAPLAHPLPIAFGALLSPLEPGIAYDVFTVVAALSWALMAFAAYRLVRVLLGPGRQAIAVWAGVLCVVLLLTRVRIDFFALKATVEIPFTALLLLAASYVVETPRTRPWLPLALLVPAGLLRPESWALGLLYLGWLAYNGMRGRRLAACAALALAPIAGWVLFAAIVTGDPLSPITGNPEAENIESFGFSPPASYSERAPFLTHTADVIDAAVDNIRATLGDELAIFALFAIVAAWLPLLKPERRTPDRLRIAGMAGLIVFLIVQAMILAELGAPLVERYVFPSAVLIVVLASAAIFVAAPRRAAIPIGAVVLLLVTTGSLGGNLPVWPTLPKVRDKVELSRVERDEQEDLYRLTSVERVRRTVRPCNKVRIGGRGGIYNVLYAKPLIAHGLERDPRLVDAERSPRGKVTASSFRRLLPHGPKPYIKENSWTFRSPCLRKDYVTVGLPARRREKEEAERRARKRAKAAAEKAKKGKPSGGEGRKEKRPRRAPISLGVAVEV